MLNCYLIFIVRKSSDQKIKNWVNYLITKQLTHILRKGRDSNPRYAKRTTVFETAPIDHSGTFPVLPSGCYSPKSGCKVRANFPPDKIFSQIFQSLDGLDGVFSAKNIAACNEYVGTCLGELSASDIVHAAVNLDLGIGAVERDELT